MRGSSPRMTELLLLESRAQQAELPLDRIATANASHRRMDRCIEAAYAPLQRLGTLDQDAQALRQQENILFVGVVAGNKLDLGFFLAGLGERHLALLHRAVQQQP